MLAVYKSIILIINMLSAAIVVKLSPDNRAAFVKSSIVASIESSRAIKCVIALPGSLRVLFILYFAEFFILHHLVFKTICNILPYYNT